MKLTFDDIWNGATSPGPVTEPATDPVAPSTFDAMWDASPGPAAYDPDEEAKHDGWMLDLLPAFGMAAGYPLGVPLVDLYNTVRAAQRKVSRILPEEVSPKHMSLGRDFVNAVYETPDNIKVGLWGVPKMFADAAKRRMMLYSGSGVFPDEMLQHQYELISVPEQKQRAGMPAFAVQNPLEKMYGKPTFPGAIAAEAAGMATRIPDVISTAIADKQTRLQLAQDEVTLGSAPITRIMRGLWQSGVPSIAMATATTLLTGSPEIGLAMFYETTAGQTFDSMRKEGLTIPEAGIVSSLSGAAEVAGEMLVFPKFIRGLKEGIPLCNALVLIAENAGQETVTGFTQGFTETFAVEMKKGTPLRKAIGIAYTQAEGEAIEGGIVGGLSFGMIEAMTLPKTIYTKASERRQLAKESASIPADGKAEKQAEEAQAPTPAAEGQAVATGAEAKALSQRIEGDLTESGTTRRGGDYWNTQIAKLSDEDLVTFVEWTQTQENGHIKRFIGSNADAELRRRQRIVPAVATEKPQETAAEAAELLQGIGYSTFDISQMDAATRQELAQEAQRLRDAEPPHSRDAGFVSVPFDTPSPEAVAEAKERIYQKLVNRFHSIHNLVEKAKALGYSPLSGENPSIGARRYLGLGKVVQATLEKNTYRFTKEGDVVVTGEGLKPILDDYDKKAKSFEANRAQRETDFQDYLVAQRTVEDLQRAPYEGAPDIATPEQVAAAQERKAELMEKYGVEGMVVIEDAAQRLYGYQDRVLHLLVDAGNLSRLQYDTIKGVNPHYIPFDRVLDQAGIEGGVPGSKERFTKARAPVKRIKGSEREIQDVVGSVVKNTYRVMDAAARNTIARDVAKLGKVLPDDINPVRIKMVPIRVDPREILTLSREFRSQSSKIVEESRDIKTTNGEGASIAGPIAKLEKVVKDALQKRGFSEPESNSFIAQIRKGKPGEASTNTVDTIQQIIKETQQVIISQEPIETTIFRPSAFAPKGKVIEYFVGGKRKYMEVPENVYQAMTGLNEASSNLLIDILAKPAHWLRIGATSTPEFVLRNPMRDQWTAAMQTNFGFIPFVDTIGAIADVLGKTDLYYEWMASGSAYSGFVELNRPALKKAVQSLRNSRGKQILRRLNVIADMQDLSQLMEVATRIGVFKRARQSGLTSAEAATEARDATIDFQRRGASMAAVNKVIAFFNAGVQGVDKSIRNSIHRPGRTALAGVMSITLPSLLLYLLNRDDDKYKEIPQWQKDIFWIVPVGGIYFRIPKPFLYGQIFGSLPERFFAYLDTKDPEAFRGLSQSIYDSLSPVSGSPESGLLFTGIKPIIENASPNGYNFFMERPIVPRGRESLLPEDQYTQYTSETAKELGKILNYSPAKIENLTRGYFGGSGRYALQAGDVLVNAIRREKLPEKPMDLANVPLVKGFVVRDPGGRSAESVNRFYEDSEPLIAAESSKRAAIKSGDASRIRDIDRKYPEVDVAPQLRSMRTALSALNKQSNIILSSDLPANEKRTRIDSLNEQRLRIAQQGNRIMKQYKSRRTP